MTRKRSLARAKIIAAVDVISDALPFFFPELRSPFPGE